MDMSMDDMDLSLQLNSIKYKGHLQQDNRKACNTSNNNTKTSHKGTTIKRSVTLPTFPVTKLLTKHRTEVSLIFQEPYVETGFRESEQPWSYYWKSLFHPHNELLNVWTHLIGILITLYQFVQFCQEVDIVKDAWSWPMVSGFLDNVIMYCCSAGAHLLHSRSAFSHCVCFMVDYAGVALCGFGACVMHFAYSTEDDLYPRIKSFYMILAVILGANATLANCYSKVMYSKPYPKSRLFLQIYSVGSIYVFSMVPVLHRFYSCHFYHEHCDDSLHLHLYQTLSFITAAFFFSCSVPQCFLKPGACDIVGRNHQFFHVFILFTIYYQIRAVHADFYLERMMFAKRTPPTLFNTFGVSLLLIGLQTAIIYMYVLIMRRRERAGKGSKIH